MYILGISCFYHDSAACLLKDGDIIAAAEEERFTRKKHDPEFPENAIRYCLDEAGISINDVAFVGFYDKPFLKFERLLRTSVVEFPRSFPSFIKAVPAWLRQKFWIKEIIRERLGYRGEILFAEHHVSHAASAFLASPFDEAAVLTLDGVGEWATSSYGAGRGNYIEILKEISFPHSLGLLYSAFTYYLGFRVNSGEYKVMGLAAYGEPVYYDKVRELIDIRDDGSFSLDMRYFSYQFGLRMVNGRFSKLFGGPPRRRESPIDKRHMDIAASVQKATEEVVIKMANHVHGVTGFDSLCMAGGVALNCVANGKVLKAAPFKKIYVQPAAGDAGGAIGVAAYIHNTVLGNKRSSRMDHAYLGPGYNEREIKDFLDSTGVRYREQGLGELTGKTARLLSEGNVIGWFQGRMEFGPRALGNRSILADPRDKSMQEKVNVKIKLRERFRPFAPAVLEERAGEYFDLNAESPFMLLVGDVKKETIPAVTHADGSARVQTVSRRTNPLFHRLIEEFGDITGVPVLMNTSFNIRGEPMVCAPAEAFRCFMRTDMDYLVLGGHILDKKEMPELEDDEGRDEKFELD